jgi:hypothetical protein
VHDDLDDTIARGSRARAPMPTGEPDVDDTIIVQRASPAQRPPLVAVVEPAAPEAPASGVTDAAPPVDRAEPRPSADTPEATSFGPTVPISATVVPVLVEPPRPTPVPAEPGVAHYRFRIGGTIVFLDRAAYIGRNPSRPRVLRDGLPRLVQVPSIAREVSSTHLEIRQRGASVVVTDLRSTNGTIVNIPGGTPTKLRQGESMVVTPGTLIDIGDGNLIEILPLQRR